MRKDDNAAYIIHCSMWQPHSTSKFSNIWITVHSDSNIGDEFDNPFGLDTVQANAFPSNMHTLGVKLAFLSFGIHLFHFLIAVNNSHYVE